MPDIAYVSEVRIERLKGILRKAYLPAEREPVMFGITERLQLAQQGNYIRLIANTDSGTAPLNATLTITGSFSITNSQYDGEHAGEGVRRGEGRAAVVDEFRCQGPAGFPYCAAVLGDGHVAS